MHHSCLTLVVPTKNEIRNIGRLLASLPDDLELILVDAGDDGTAELAESLRPGYTTVIHRQTNIPVARNIGAQAAATPWVLFTDADVVFAPDYFPTLALLSHADAFYGCKQAGERYQRYDRLFLQGQRWFSRLGIPAVSGSNFLVRREVLLDVGGFDLALNCNEDSEIGWRIARAGYRIKFAPQLKVYESDHRRLDQGTVRKLLHTTARCALLYTNLLPQELRTTDWGYWSEP